MFAKTFAVFAVLSGTVLPTVILSIHAVKEAQIPHCSLDLPARNPSARMRSPASSLNIASRGMLASIS